jgi:YD repeat-containing protein
MRQVIVVAFALCFSVALLLPNTAPAEDQIRDAYGRVIEIRQYSGNVTYAYDAYRRPIYTAIDVTPPTGTFLDYRDRHGVYLGTGGPSTLSGSVRSTWLEGAELARTPYTYGFGVGPR